MNKQKLLRDEYVSNLKLTVKGRLDNIEIVD